MKFAHQHLLVATAAAAALGLSSPAGAVIVGVSAPFPDPSSAGADPLFNGFTTNIGGLSWVMGPGAFNVLSLGYGDGLPIATIFRYTINNGIANGIDTAAAMTFFKDLTTGQTWSAAFFNAGPTPNQRVEFTAPAGTFISPGDQFEVRVGFVTPLSKPRYSWSASWDNTFTVPEPTTWALMIGGFALAGMGLRRRRVAA